jgi:hypothetical protein
MVLVNPILRTIAESHPSLGYRRVWAKAKASGYNKSLSTAYRELSKGDLLLPHPSYAELKEAFLARREYLVKPSGPNQLFQADFTSVNIPGYPLQPVLLVMAGLYGMAAGLFYRRLTRLLRDWQMLSATLDQLRKDRACLEKNLT